MWKITISTLILAMVAVGLTIYKSPSKKLDPKLYTPQASTPSDLPNKEELTMEVIATNLEVPWALAFLLNKDILVTERAGRVRIIKNGKLEEKPLITLSEVKQVGESGLHGIAIHPDYPQEPFIYLYYTYSSNGENSLNKVSRFTLDNDVLKNEQVILDKIPGAIFHDGGRIKFGPDKFLISPGEIKVLERSERFLYITTGDALKPSLAQDINSTAGKILRVTDDGKAPPGNPFNNLVYSYGHRNPQGIAWDDKGNLWETEHGQSATDEVNLIEIGKNYGWPIVRGDQAKQGMVTPRIQSGSNTWAPAGMAFVNGSLFFAGLRGQAIFELNLETMELKEHFAGELGRIRDVVLGPDEMLYITTSNRDGRGSPASDDDKVIRINPTKL